MPRAVQRERLTAIAGRLAVRSAPGAGTSAVLTVPLPCTADPEPRAEAAGDGDGSPAAGARVAAASDGDRVVRVLIADDHGLVRQGLASMLGSDERLAVVGEASDGEEAISGVERYRPDAVLMDVNMPRRNGVEATREIRRRWPHVPVIALSVQDDEATCATMRDAGAVAFFSKSVDTERLVGTLLEVGRRRR